MCTRLSRTFMPSTMAYRNGPLLWMTLPHMGAHIASQWRSCQLVHTSPCFASRLNRSVKDAIPYSREALRQDLARVRNAWEDCQASRERNAIYGYLSAVFDLVMWWAAEDRAISRVTWALQLHGLDLPSADEPFAAIIFCTSDPEKVDRRTRSKWSRVMRYAIEYKTNAEPLAQFVHRKGGINKCAARFTRCLGSARSRVRRITVPSMDALSE